MSDRRVHAGGRFLFNLLLFKELVDLCAQLVECWLVELVIFSRDPMETFKSLRQREKFRLKKQLAFPQDAQQEVFNRPEPTRFAEPLRNRLLKSGVRAAY